MTEKSLAVFENYKIRRVYNEEAETWYFSVVDIIQVLIQQPDYQAARNYWKVLKNRLNKEGSETVTKCNRLKMVAGDTFVCYAGVGFADYPDYSWAAEADKGHTCILDCNYCSFRHSNRFQCRYKNSW